MAIEVTEMVQDMGLPFHLENSGALISGIYKENEPQVPFSSLCRGDSSQSPLANTFGPPSILMSEDYV